jgi:transcriptional regulator with XRE-family HTH domain
MTFGEKIKKLRNEKNWTQDFVANRLNISSPALSRYESGTCEPKDLAMVSEFAKLYNVTTDYLLGLSDEKDNTSTQSNDKEFAAFWEEYKDLDNADKEILKATLDAFVKAKKKE